jgi:hypothetical protein
LATLLREDFAQVYGRELPTVVQCFTDDFDACIAHLRFPLRHRKVIRTTDESVKWHLASSGDRWAWAWVTPTEAAIGGRGHG